MFWLKGCPHCKGDLAEGQDIYGRYVECLQCARYLTDIQSRQLLIFGQLTAANSKHGPVITKEGVSELVRAA